MDVAGLKDLIEEPTGAGFLVLALLGVFYVMKEAVSFLREHVVPRYFEERLARRHLAIPFAAKALDMQWREAAHFRDGDPKHIDFRRKMIFIRPEVAQIEVELRKSRFVHLEGVPSSGKTVIALTLAYKSINTSAKAIYFARPLAIPKAFLDYLSTKAAVRHLDHERTMLILDDVHLDVTQAARLFSLIFEYYSKLRVVYISRGLQAEQLLDIEGSSQFSFAQFMPKVEISAETSFKPISNYYSQQRFGRSIPPTIWSFLRHECGGDLLLLGRYLREWDGSPIANLEKLRARVWAAVLHDLESLRVISPDAVQVFLVLALFYRFEVPIERSFLEEELELQVEALIARGDILLDNGFVRVHHSSQAKLYSNAIQSLNMPDFVALSRALSPFPMALFKSYLLHHPRNSCELIAAIRGSKLLDALLVDLDLTAVLCEAFEKEASLDLLGWALLAAFRSSKRRAWHILGLAAIKDVAQERVQSATAKQVSLFLINLRRVSDAKAREWVHAVQPEVFSNVLSNLELKHFASTLELISRLTKNEYFERLVTNLNKRVVFDKIVREEDQRILTVSVGKLGSCLGNLFCVRSTSDVDLVGDWTTKVSFHFGTDRISRFFTGPSIGIPYGTSQRHLFNHWRWLVDHKVTGARIVVDDGAAAAVKRRRSLFPVGVSRVEGDFKSEDVVAICDEKGELLAVGVSNYSSVELNQVKNLRLDAIDKDTDISPNRVFDNDRVVRQKSLRTIVGDSE